MDNYEFNVETENYKIFIEELRVKVATTRLIIDGTEIYILPLKSTLTRKGKGYFTVIMRAHNKGMKFLIEHENLYLVAVKPDVSTTPWVVLRAENQIETTNFLKHYDRIVKNKREQIPINADVGLRYGSLERYGKSRRFLKLGKDALITAILGLQDFTGKCNKDFAEHLTIAIESICEAIRFRYVLDFIVSYYEEGKVPDELLEDVTLNWANMSKYIIQIANEVLKKTPVKFRDGEAELTQEEILYYVAVIKDFKADTGHGLQMNTKKWKGQKQQGKKVMHINTKEWKGQKQQGKR